jgi:hypothetical protein
MPIESSGQQIYSHGITVNYRILEDATKLVKSDAVIYAGRAVTMDPTTGLIIAGGGNVRTYGLAKSNKNSYVDETKGSFGAYGSGKMTTVLKGLVTVRPNYFVASDETIAKIKVYDDTILATYQYLQALYVDTNGLITNVTTQGNTLLGYCTKPPTSTDETMEISLDC